MSSQADKTQLTARQAADLSALADGTLDAARRDEVRAWVDASPERAALYERERQVVEMLQAVAREERAPARLRARIEADRPSRRSLVQRRAAYVGALASVLAALAMVLGLALPGGAPGGPSLSQAAALAVRGPAMAAPSPDPSAPAVQLERNI